MKFVFRPVLLVALLGSAALTAAAQTRPDHTAMQWVEPGSRSTAVPGDERAPWRSGSAGRHSGVEDSAARMERRAERVQVRVAQRLAALKVRLRLAQSQEGAWDTFARAMQPTQEQVQRRLSLRLQLEALSTPERIDRMRELRSQRDAAMDQRFDATKAFYAQLTPQQQGIFDEISTRRSGRSRPGHDRRDWHDRGRRDSTGMDHGGHPGG